jgi:hypothetical protein
MRTFFICVIPALALLSPARAQSLSPADREALLEKLEKMREEATSKADARFRAAIAAYTGASGSDEAAMELYLNCIQKADFQDQQKKESEFRDWKRKEADQLSAPGHGLALRLQLRWLILTLRAASSKTERNQLLPGVQEIVDIIAKDADRLRQHRQLLHQAVTSSAFARAYEITGVEVENWPMSPANISEIYEKILLPPLRKPDRLEALRSAWVRRIQAEIAIAQAPAGNDDAGGRKNGGGARPRADDYERFMAETVPELQWQMEMDLFRNGDQQGAAMRMLSHLEKYMSHQSARKWSDELKNILSPQQTAPSP